MESAALLVVEEADVHIPATPSRMHQYMLVKASVAEAIVTNTLFMLGLSFFLGGLQHHVQEYNRVNARARSKFA